MASHHKMGMSRWTPWSNCSHFDSVDDDASARVGNDAHDKLCRVLNGDDTLVLDDGEQVDRAIKWAAAEIRKMAGDETLYTEESVEIDAGISEMLQGIYGTVDAFFIQHDGDQKVIHIIDFKSLSHGGKDLWPQLRGYALGVASMLKCYDVNTKVCLHLLLGGVFVHDVLMTNILDCITVGERIVNERKNNAALPHCPSSWCKYCKYASSCEATERQVEVAKSGALMKFSAPKRLVLIEELEGILKKAKEEAKAEIALAPNKTMEDEGIAYAITTKNGPSALVEGKALELFNACAFYGVTADDFMNICKLGKTDVMRLLSAKGGMKMKSKKPDEVCAESIVSPFYASKPVEKLERVK